MEILSKSELLEINGGHDGEVYQHGRKVGEFLRDVVDVAGAVLTFWALKK